jgi:hypothetical protein
MPSLHARYSAPPFQVSPSSTHELPRRCVLGNPAAETLNSQNLPSRK